MSLRGFSIAIVACVALLGAVAPARAATFVVNSTLSGNNVTGASGFDAAIFTTNSAKIWNVTIADGGGYGLGALTDAYGTPIVQLQGNIFRSNAFGNVMPTSATDGALLARRCVRPV